MNLKKFKETSDFNKIDLKKYDVEDDENGNLFLVTSLLTLKQVIKPEYEEVKEKTHNYMRKLNKHAEDGVQKTKSNDHDGEIQKRGSQLSKIPFF